MSVVVVHYFNSNGSFIGIIVIITVVLCIMSFLCTGKFQSRFIPGLIGPFLKVSLLPHPGKNLTII